MDTDKKTCDLNSKLCGVVDIIDGLIQSASQSVRSVTSSDTAGTDAKQDQRTDTQRTANVGGCGRGTSELQIVVNQKRAKELRIL